MSDKNVLYFLEDRATYHDGKIDVLVSKSSGLESREIIQKLQEDKGNEQKQKAKIMRGLTKLRSEIRKFNRLLPRPEEEMPKVVKRVIQRPQRFSSESQRVPQRKVSHDPIRDEINEIKEKLRELGA